MGSTAITMDTKVIQNKEIPAVELNEEIALMNAEKGCYYSLDAIGSRIWGIIENQISIKEIVGILTEEYEVSQSTCEEHVIDLIKQFDEQGLVCII